MMTSTMCDERIKEAQNKIGEAIKLLKDAYNDKDALLSDLVGIDRFAQLLNATDFEKTITG